MRASVVILLSLVVACQSFARAKRDTEFVVAEVGSGAQAPSFYWSRFLPADLSDWSDSDSKTSSRLINQCGLLSEAKVVGGSRTNLLFLGVVNNSSKSIRIERNRISAKFSSGKERILIESSENSFIDVPGNSYSWGFIAFPSKGDFKDQDDLRVSVPIASSEGNECKLEFRFERNKKVIAEPNSYLEAPQSVYSFGYLISAGITPVAATTFNNYKPDGFGLYTANFSHVNSGSFMNFDAQNLGDVYPSEYFNASTFKSAWLWTFTLGPVWRSLYSTNLSGFINIGPSLGYLRAQAFDDKDEIFRISPGIYASYSLDWCFLKGRPYKEKGDHSFGLTLFAKYYPWLFDGSRTDYGLIGISFDIFRGGE
ncbi:hypothetical protein ACLVWU_12290 [Bdellovibrio sp. HCB290]|uniref:hypothetical protein n=1 Tax=Bdellovibrio sp. HCB290 TaxID=3394356 RepID=UPI0039B49319